MPSACSPASLRSAYAREVTGRPAAFSTNAHPSGEGDVRGDREGKQGQVSDDGPAGHGATKAQEWRYESSFVSSIASPSGPLGPYEVKNWPTLPTDPSARSGIRHTLSCASPPEGLRHGGKDLGVADRGWINQIHGARLGADPYCRSMFAFCATAAHRAISSLIRRLNAAGSRPPGSPLMPATNSFISGQDRAFFTSACNRATISFGAPLGAARPD